MVVIISQELGGHDPRWVAAPQQKKYILYVYILLLLTRQSKVLLEKLISSEPVKKFPAFYGTRRFITACTIAHHLSLS
jgi:hypothetical protein